MQKVFTLTITKAGRAALINAAQTGTEKRTVVSAGITETTFTVSEDLTSVPNELLRVESVSGAAIAPDQISTAIYDNNPANRYMGRGIGLYLDDGTLLAAYSQENIFLAKTEFSEVHNQFDIAIVDASINVESIQFGSMEFLLPLATETFDGVVRMATEQEALAMTLKGANSLNPYLLGQVLTSLKASIEDWRNNASGQFVTIDMLKKSNIFLPLGLILPMPYRASELPPGWIHANGDKFSTTSAIGKALKALPTTYKADEKIIESDGLINLPTRYHSDGRAYYPRYGSVPGVIRSDAIRNIVGRIEDVHTGTAPKASGVLKWNTSEKRTAPDTGSKIWNWGTLSIDLSEDFTIANELRVLEFSGVPAVFLGDLA